MKVTIEHPASKETIAATVEEHHTPDEVIQGLLEENFLSPPKNNATYTLIHNGTRLLGQQSLVQQGVNDGAFLNAAMDAVGAAPTERRLRLDFASSRAVTHGCVRSVTVYSDATRKQEVRSEEQAAIARYYVVDYQVEALTQDRSLHKGFLVSFDIDAVFDEYPHSGAFPRTTCISNPRPWHHRVYPSSGLFCTGESPDPALLLGHHIIHVAKLLNFDEPWDKDHDRGYNPTAYEEYKRRWGGRPINPRLAVPVLDESALNRHRSTQTKAKVSFADRSAPASAPSTRKRGSISFRRSGGGN